MKIIVPGGDERYLGEAVRKFRSARLPLALTGAGISVASGIPDFRSPGGLWTRFAPNEYATLEVFLQKPEKAWQFYRALGSILQGKEPNEAHYALARLEQQGLLHGVITQNVDMLHQRAGSKVVLEIHGEHRHLQCLQCGELEEANEEHYRTRSPPVCRQCGYILKPNVVLYGEAVRKLDEIYFLLQHCDLLLVVGTSVQVHPAAALPSLVKQNNGLIYEFNLEGTTLTWGQTTARAGSDFFFRGDAAKALQLFADTAAAS
ncbi:MAG: Sir2 family NAD-dependent protein deacetylase [Desulfobulbaceae bacterium]|nr:Sir2 family NAD-dependent protein deacetylase [Desulfobulbaceae bacterium]